MTDRILELEVVPVPDPGKRSMFADDAAPTPAAVDQYKASQAKLSELGRRLARNGFVVRHVGEFSVSAACTEAHFETFFRSKLSDVSLPVPSGAPPRTIRAPRKGAPFDVPQTDGLDVR